MGKISLDILIGVMIIMTGSRVGHTGSPPNHPDGTVHKTNASADAAEAAEHH